MKMEETRREMKGPSLNMNDVNKLTNMVPGAQPDSSELRAKMRNKFSLLGFKVKIICMKSNCVAIV